MKIVAEIGINHNGDIELAKKMMDAAKLAGCDYVKFQKRDVLSCYSKEYLDQPRESPWGHTQREQKFGLEFGHIQYNEIDRHAEQIGLPWFASPWDVPSVEFLEHYSPPFIKVAGAMVTNISVLEAIKDTGIPVILSTGGSTATEIKRAFSILGDNQIEYVLACTSTYPCTPEEQNLQFIGTLQKEVFRTRCKIGFSNHSPGITFCIVAAALGAKMIEYHMTLDRSMYGSDQAASIEVGGMMSLNKKLHQIKAAMGTGRWTVFDSEKKVMDKLRRKD
jgi:N-acetylneuraminate synthase